MSSSAERAPRILCAGIIVLDEVFRVDEFPQPDGKVQAREFFVVNGGCAANAAVAIARLGGRVRAVISGWPQYQVFGSCAEQVRVYWAQDDFVGGADLLGLNARLLDRRERRVAASADLVVAANPVVADIWRSRGLDPVLVPYGTDVDAYREIEQAPVPADAILPAPVAGLVGRINDRIDLSLLEAIADRGRSLLLVGPKDPAFEPERFEALRQRLHELLATHPVAIAAIGRGTNAAAVAEIARTLGLRVELVDERETTLLARSRYFDDHPPRGWRRFVPRGMLLPSRPIDDYAALLIAERYLKGS